MKKKVLEFIDKVIPDQFSNQIHLLLKDCVYCVHINSTSKISDGISKFGGLPLLPPLMEWPEEEGRQLSFVAQLELENLKKTSPSVNIKDDGLLSFFYDDINGVCGTKHRVYLFNKEELIASKEKKPKTHSSYIFPEKNYHFIEGVSIPNSLEEIDHPLHKKFDYDYVDVIGAFYGLCDHIFGDYDQFGGYTTGNYDKIPKNGVDLVIQFNHVYDRYHYLIPVKDGHLALDEISVYYTTS